MPKIKATIIEKQEYDDDLFRVRFKLEDDLKFEAGQFMSVGVEGYIRRSYSIANSPERRGYLETYVDCSPAGPGSRYFMNVEVGDEADLLVPLGHFVYWESQAPCSFFATGTGIVPFLSMIEYELEVVKSGRVLNLFYGVRTPQRIMVGDRLDELVEKYENLHVETYVSRPPGSWDGKTGRITSAVPKHDFTDHEVYICGGGEMINEVAELVQQHGANVDKIYYERYY